MLKQFFRRRIGAFERNWNYDAGYVYDLIDADLRAFIAFGTFQTIANYRKDVPAAAYFAARVVAARTEDCGPCTQLAVDMAEREGVEPAVLRAILARDHAAMPYPMALAARFAEATLAHAPEADDLRAEVVDQFGKRGQVSLAFAILAGRMYPTLKYALGHGRACRRLTIGGQSTPVVRAAGAQGDAERLLGV
jgi:hypothetical protein